MSKVSDLCDAIVYWLNSQEYDVAFVAERANVWNNALERNTDVHVVVIPQEVETTIASRAAIERRYTVNIVVQQRMSGTIDIDDQDALMNLVEQIEAGIINEPMGDFRFIDHGSAMRTVIASEIFSTQRQFVATMTLRYLGQ